MRSKTVFVVIAGVLALLAIVYWSLTSVDSGASPPHATPTAETDTPPLAAELATPTEPVAERATDVIVAAAAPATPLPANECELRGRVLFPGGSPVRNATVQVRGWEGNAERVEQFGRPKDWHDLASITDEGGRFRVRFVPPRAFQFVLEIRATLYAPVSWRWSSIAPGEVKDLGDVELERGATIAGRVVDAHGRPLFGTWNVDAEVSDGELGANRQAPRSWARVDSSTGAYALDAVRPGKVRVTASSNLGADTETREIEVVAGTTTELDLLYGGPDLSRRIVVAPSFAKRPTLARLVTAIDMHGPGGDRRITQTRGSSSFVIDDLEPGSYSFSIDDPRFEPWSVAGVVPGTRVRAALRGSSGIALRVLDASNATSLSGYSVTLRIAREHASPQSLPLLEAGDAPPADSVYSGIVAGDYEVSVRAPGKVECVVALKALAPGEVRVLVAQPGAGASIEGRVFEADGHTPAADVEVLLARAGASASRMHFGDAQELERSTRTTSDGRFHFDTLPNENIELRALHGFHVTSPLVTVSREFADTGDEVVLVLPAWGRLHGRVRVPNAGAARTVRLSLIPRDVSKEERHRLAMGMFLAGGRDTFELAADGAYATSPLPAGNCRAILRLPALTVKTERSSTTTGGGEIELGEVLVVAGTDSVHDFDTDIAFPGGLVVHVRGEETRGKRWLVQSTSADEAERSQGLGVTDEHGDLSVSAVLPGEYWLDIAPLNQAWLHVVPQKLRIESGRETEVVVELRTFEGVLVVRDARGPLAGQDVQVTTLTPTYREVGRRVQTNQRGELRLRMPTGRLRLSLASAGAMPMGYTDSSDRDNRTIDVEWTAAGPVPDTVTFGGAR